MSIADSDPDAVQDDQPTMSLMGTHAGDRCSQCGAELASDQRYCVECGHRRGRARFSIDRSQSGAAASAPTPVPAGRPARTVNSTVALIASVGVLLLAMGVGVLIGHNNSGSSGKAQVIYAPGSSSAGSSAGTSATTANTGASAASSSSSPKSAAAAQTAAQASAPKSKAAQAKAVKAPPSKKAVAAASKAAAATATLSGSKTTAKVAPPTAKLGSSCTAGTAGCQNGKLTGNYFP